jgi:hypothetical protein
MKTKDGKEGEFKLWRKRFAVSGMSGVEGGISYFGLLFRKTSIFVQIL